MPRKRLTLKDKQKKKQQTSFVGRTEQLTAFQENLNLSAESDAFINIFNIYGQGGVGKTTLLRKYEDSCGRKDVLTAYTDEGVKDVVDFMASVASELDKKGHPLKKFNERYKVYRQKKQELEADPKAPEGLAAFMGSSIVKGSAFALKATPGISPFVDMVDTDGLAKHAGDWASFVAKKIGNKDEVQLVLEPIEVLTPIWLEGLVDIAEDQRVCLLIDTYEMVSTFLDEWLYKVIDNRYADFDANILLTIAGRHPLDENRWSAYAEFCAAFPVNPFTEEEANTFLDQRKITAEPVRAAIKKLSGHVPVLMATLAKASPDKVEDLDDVSHLAVDRFLKWIEDPNKRAAALYGAVPQELNIDVLKQVLPEDTAAEAFDWLQSMPFVQKRAKQWAYHPVVREQMLKYLRLRSMEKWAELQQKLYAYYQAKQSALNIKQQEQYKNENWRQYALRMLYHGFCGQPEAYLPTALNAFVAALDEKRSFALEVARTLRDAEVDTEVASKRQWGEAMENALEEYNNDEYSKLAHLMKRMLDTAHLEEGQQAMAYAWQANCLRLSGEYERAIELFSNSIELKGDYEWAIAMRGETYRRNGQYKDALKDFEKALELAPDDSWSLTKIGVVLLSEMDNYNGALSFFDRAIELNPEYIVALVNRGFTYLELGKKEKALLDFDRAIELDPQEVFAFLFRGETYRQLGNYEEALSDFNRVIELDPEVDWVFAERGEIYLEMDAVKEAKLSFQEASRIDHKDDWPHYMLYLCSLKLDEESEYHLNQAIALSQESLEKDENDHRVRFNLALYQLVKGSYDAAQKVVGEAIEKGANHNDLNSFLEGLQFFLKLFPDTKLVQQMLVWVEEKKSSLAD
ncbi:tetratricopeptide repeat protein [Phaeodactylibacter xiamenensis]|uniref:tetratricopeptide repeat protein n=1 Tax=Phaeodactylibacter xiamenensis TaxID=1524460 RepID=UPI003CCBABCA